MQFTCGTFRSLQGNYPFFSFPFGSFFYFFFQSFASVFFLKTLTSPKGMYLFLTSFCLLFLPVFFFYFLPLVFFFHRKKLKEKNQRKKHLFLPFCFPPGKSPLWGRQKEEGLTSFSFPFFSPKENETVGELKRRETKH